MMMLIVDPCPTRSALAEIPQHLSAALTPLQHKSRFPPGYRFLLTSGCFRQQKIKDRRLSLSPILALRSPATLIKKCPDSNCGAWILRCPECEAPWQDDSADGCYPYPIVFTDGACPGNGTAGAVAGIGVTCGFGVAECWAEGVQDTMFDDPAEDSVSLRTSQRAELIAAIRGVEFLFSKRRRDVGRPTEHRSNAGGVVATDSEYVVKGITEWYPTWRANNWHTSAKKMPANLDLFHRLNNKLKEVEQQGFAVGFWHIPREFNLADPLAKLGADKSRSFITSSDIIGAMEEIKRMIPGLTK